MFGPDIQNEWEDDVKSKYISSVDWITMSPDSNLMSLYYERMWFRNKLPADKLLNLKYGVEISLIFIYSSALSSAEALNNDEIENDSIWIVIKHSDSFKHLY